MLYIGNYLDKFGLNCAIFRKKMNLLFDEETTTHKAHKYSSFKKSPSKSKIY